MAYDLRTRNGHNMYDMASLLQKSIRRADYVKAGYAAMELFGSFHKYLWKRLLIISAEDCYGIMTKEIIGLKLAEDQCFGDRKGYDKDPLFVAKAITLLCSARKNRDACYFACNYMLPDRLLNEEDFEHIDIVDIEACQLEDSKIPDYVFDIHTLRGKANGKTDLDMVITEQNALTPHQIGLFDDYDWHEYFQMRRSKGECSEGEWAEFLKFKKQKEEDRKRKSSQNE